MLFYLAIYAPAMLGALCVSAALGRAPTLPDLHGLMKRRPLEAVALSLSLLSLAGLPAAGGFIAKLFLLRVLIDGSLWVLVGIVVAGSSLGFFYYAKFFTAPLVGHTHDESEPLPQLDRVLLIVCIALIVIFGVAPAGLLNVVTATMAP